jgi:ketosteroid isomerase-like protein
VEENMSSPTLSPAEQEVWQVLEAFNRAFANNDAEGFFSFFDDDISLFTPSNPYRVEGRAVDREEYDYGQRVGYSRVKFFQPLQPQINVFGDMAVVTYYTRGSYGPTDKLVYLKETDVLVRRGGVWKVFHIHISATNAG